MIRKLIGPTVRLAIAAFAFIVMPGTANAQQALTVKALAEKNVTELPAGPLFWRLENFSTLVEAQAAVGSTGFVVQSGGKIWLIKLGPAGGASMGGTKVAEVGPLPNVTATQYLLRINEASGLPGNMSSQHTHPGSEAFYVLSGETSSRTSDAVTRVSAGHGEVGSGGDTPLQVSSSGSTDLLSLVMFVLDATKPFSSPAKF